MLQELRVSQFAIIDALQIEFQIGLNILSGETGSGKSVLLKSLGLLMGEKASSDTIRTGCKTATVEGSFNLKKRPDLEKKLSDLGIEVDSHQLIVRRIISAEDKSKVYLNGVLSPLSQLRDFVAPLIEVTGPNAPLIEMTGQHDNRNLLSKSYHLDLLDQYAHLWDKRQIYETKFSAWSDLKNNIFDFEKKSQEKSQRLDFLKFQFQEYSDLDLDLEIDLNLEQEIKTLKNSSRLVGFADLCDQLIYQDDDSVSARLKTLIKKSNDLASVDKNMADQIANLEQAQSLIDDAVYSIRSYVQKIDADPIVLDQKESRLSQIRKLQKKHGDDLNALVQYFLTMQSEILNLENSDQHILELKKQCSLFELELKKLAEDLHLTRLKFAKKLSSDVNTELEDLNMKGVTFDIHIQKLDTLSPTGLSDIEFLSQTSPKDPKRPIAKVASGGELSRILLALKKSVGATTTSSKNGQLDSPRTYLFDEVDTGVSGTTAEKVGRKLKEIARGQQVICVTHLPQVAACGDVHFSIQKSNSKNQAIMTVQELNKKERIAEIARLISGEKISKTSLAHAEQLLKESL
jgi:DNA repair protein RecN (Recombination protein N)